MGYNGKEYNRSVPSLLLLCAVRHVTWWGCVWLLCSVCYKHWLIFMESQGISSPRDHSSVVTLGVSRARCQEAGGDVRSESYFSVMWCANPVCTRANIPPSYSIILRTPCERHRGYTTFPHIPRKNVWNLNLSVYNFSIKYIMPCFQSIWKPKPFKIRQIVKSNSIQNFAFFPGKRI